MSFLQSILGTNLESGMLIWDYLGKYWTDVLESFTEYVESYRILCKYKFKTIRFFRIPDLAQVVWNLECSFGMFLENTWAIFMKPLQNMEKVITFYAVINFRPLEFSAFQIWHKFGIWNAHLILSWKILDRFS